jgi:hypothetical protein
MVHRGSVHIQEGGLRYYGWVKPRYVSAIRYSSKKILVFSDFSNSQNRACKLRLDLEMYTSR